MIELPADEEDTIINFTGPKDLMPYVREWQADQGADAVPIEMFLVAVLRAKVIEHRRDKMIELEREASLAAKKALDDELNSKAEAIRAEAETLL